MAKKLETNLLSQVGQLEGANPALAKAGPKKGVKSKSWDEDPQILARLESVAQMMLRHARLWQIAGVFGYAISTARKDRERVKELWAREAAGAVNAHRQQSIAQFRHVQQAAWAEWDKHKDPQLLRIVGDRERDIVALQGTERPVAQDINLHTDNDRPLEHLSDAELAALEGTTPGPKGRNKKGDDQA